VLRIRESDLTWREVDGEVVALDLVSSTYFTTNGSGAVLWHRLVGGATHRDLVRALVERYGIDEDRAAADVDGFLDVLRSNGFLQEDAAGG
jgi:hypothetical protein